MLFDIYVLLDGLTLGYIYFIIYITVKSYLSKRRIEKELRRCIGNEKEEPIIL